MKKIELVFIFALILGHFVIVMEITKLLVDQVECFLVTLLIIQPFDWALFSLADCV